jgi:hypothetical protein
MRIRIIQRPGPQSIDGVRLDRFEPGFQYDVGHTLGALLLAERWAEPVSDDQPGLIVPFSETDPYTTPLFPDGPANLVRERNLQDLGDKPEIALDCWRQKPRSKIGSCR